VQTDRRKRKTIKVTKKKRTASQEEQKIHRSMLREVKRKRERKKESWNVQGTAGVKGKI